VNFVSIAIAIGFAVMSILALMVAVRPSADKKSRRI